MGGCRIFDKETMAFSLEFQGSRKIQNSMVASCLGYPTNKDRIWWLRNQIIHSDKSPITDFNQWAFQVNSAFHEMLRACLPIFKADDSSHWNLPPEEWIKVNFDAAVQATGSWAAAIVVSSSGHVLATRTKFPLSTDPLVAEVQATLATQLAKSIDSKIGVILEGDSQVEIEAINSTGRIL
ncbi:Ribonuclease H-like domain containing protein [Quillaja saponaria]|uniref:Ribonuclease H-like domain containing protein n=1 Tax=Quillaja saponaria TaxID=32244 RepID=A0AAD7PMH7_QUISA|nr:Ribonuclease H-like domain containing protein [Quillaja saponaria]